MNYLKITSNIFAVYQKQGKNKNGNPIYIINFFELIGDNYQNTNYKYMPPSKMDKYGNIKVTSYNITSTIKNLMEV